eukprot:scaffold1618_cov158-Ochromonas_danica.AAC.1
MHSAHLFTAIFSFRSHDECQSEKAIYAAKNRLLHSLTAKSKQHEQNESQTELNPGGAINSIN